METLMDFFSFRDPNIRYVVFGTMLLSASAAIVGSFILLKKKALVGDAVSHSILPGICAAFLFSGSKNTALMVVGAFITGWVSLVTIDYITAKSKIKKDAAIGLVLSVFFGIGIVMLTYIQRSGNAAQSGLEHFLFGNAASLIGTDLIVFAAISTVLLTAIILFFKAFTLISFDEPFAHAIGYPVRKLDLLLTSLTVLAVVTGITAVGVVLMAAMLITPAAAARYWTDDIRTMVKLSAVFGAFSGLCGAYISFVAPAMPTGPWMVVVSSIIAFFSFFLAPRKGIIPKSYVQLINRRTMTNENILKAFFHLGEKENDFHGYRSVSELLQIRKLRSLDINWALRKLVWDKLLLRKGKTYSLTNAGLARAARVVKLHRLWELYLTNQLHIASDHVHDDAETIEHIITPELEIELERQLGFPEKDPHDAVIPKY